MATINPQDILYALKMKLQAHLPIRAGHVIYKIDSVLFTLDGTEWEFKYEPIKGATTCLAAYADGRLVKSFENPDQAISYFYAKESSK